MTAEKVCVIGIWHLGAVTSACLADAGYRVTGFDDDAGRIENLNNGIPPLLEAGLGELIAKNEQAANLSYTTDIRNAVQDARYLIVAFDTPVDDNDDADLSGVFGAIEQAVPFLKDGVTILITSQVPVGTCAVITGMIAASRPDLKFRMSYSPENLKLGQAIERFNKPGRIVVGAEDEETLDDIEQLFSVIDAPVIRMNLASAEMTKHALNAYLGMSISFINEIANLCDEAGADAFKVAEALKTDDRVSPKAPLRPGLGFAGATLARDLRTLQHLGERSGYDTPFIDAVFTVNTNQNHLVMRKIKKLYDSPKDLNIGVLGLTYKPGTSTLRRSVSLEIIGELVAGGAAVTAYDPEADLTELPGKVDFISCDSPYAAAENTDALVLVTEWPEFTSLDFDKIKAVMRKPVIIDAQNMLESDLLVEKGFTYLGVGRGFTDEGTKS